MVDGPGLSLWDDDGRLPEEPGFVRDFLGLSAALIEDLLAWTSLMDERHVGEEDMDEWVATGEQLRGRLEAELGNGFRVDFVR